MKTRLGAADYGETSVAAAACQHARAAGAAVNALRERLERLRDVIVSLPESSYKAAPSRVSGSIGAHVRHCLDHVRALVAGRGIAVLTYDSRLRGTLVETDAAAAAIEIDRLCVDLEHLADAALDEPLLLESSVDRGGTAVHVWTTVTRELTFVLQHTIHHFAIIAVLLDWLGVRVAPDLGYAPSTPLSH